MPFERPTLAALIDQVQSDIESRLPSTQPRLRWSILGVLARVWAGLLHGVYGFVAYLSRQILPDSAETEYLERHADWWGVTRLAASAASGSVTLSGIAGTRIPSGTLLQRTDGVQYATLTEVTLDAVATAVEVVAQSAGQAGNTSASTPLSLVSPISGLQSSALVGAEGLTGGADTEGDEALRARLMQRVKSPAQGGSAADYERWALEVAGVTRAWALPLWQGAGSVGVAIMRDLDADPFPGTSEVASVQAHIDAKRPVTAMPTVFAPIAYPVDFTLSVTPDTSAVRAAVEAELIDLFARAAVEDGNGSGRVPITHIREAISSATGETDHLLISPSADITPAAGELATLGSLG